MILDDISAGESQYCAHGSVTGVDKAKRDTHFQKNSFCIGERTSGLNSALDDAISYGFVRFDLQINRATTGKPCGNTGVSSDR